MFEQNQLASQQELTMPPEVSRPEPPPPEDDPTNPNLDGETLARIQQPRATDQIQRERNPEEWLTDRQIAPDIVSNPDHLRSDLLQEE